MPWPSPNCCRHLGSEPAGERSLSVSVTLVSKQINILVEEGRVTEGCWQEFPALVLGRNHLRVPENPTARLLSKHVARSEPLELGPRHQHVSG